MSEHDRLDPRYRPEFQRGYDPGVHGAVESSTPAAEPEQSDAPSHAPETARRGAPLTPASPATNHTEDAFGDVDAAASTATTAPEPPVTAPTPPPVWRNPYLIGLVVIGIALIAFGVDRYTWAVSQITPSYTGGTSNSAQPDLITPQVMWALGPLLAVAGALTLLGVGFFVAWRWIPRKRRAPGQARR